SVHHSPSIQRTHSTVTSTLPYTTLFRSLIWLVILAGATAAQEKDPALKIGEKFTLHSKILGEDRPYWIYLPESYNSKTQAPEARSEEHTSELQSHLNLVCRLLLEKKNQQ